MKKGNKFQRLAAVGIMSLSLVAPAVFAQTAATPQNGAPDTTTGAKEGHGWGRGRHWGHGIGMGFGQLNLTDEQKAQAKQIRESHRATITDLMNQLRAKHAELRQAEQGGTFNEALATQKLTEIAPIQAKLMSERLQIRQQMLTLLTPEQKAKLDEMRTQWKAKRAERHAPKA